MRSLLSKLTQWRISLKWLVIALAVAFAMRLTISVVALLLGLIPSIQLRPLTPGEVALLAVIFIVAAIPEELVGCKLNSAMNYLRDLISCDSVTHPLEQAREMSYARSEAQQVQIEIQG